MLEFILNIIAKFLMLARSARHTMHINHTLLCNKHEWIYILTAFKNTRVTAHMGYTTESLVIASSTSPMIHARVLPHGYFIMIGFFLKYQYLSVVVMKASRRYLMSL
jgi:hypothetical protein